MSELVTTEMLRDEFASAFQRVWETMIGLPCGVATDQDPRAVEESWVAAVVWIGGSWTGSVTLAFPLSFARTLAAQMLETDVGDITDAQYRDVIRELANMSAGNLKSALPGPCGLATPGFFCVRSLAGLENDLPSVFSLFYKCREVPFIAELRALH